ncbi:MAG: hypothetical protein JSU00_27070 [Acidobacteria bacterium]|nr:hypothetical protein [Acidobacteriota bacterium]
MLVKVTVTVAAAPDTIPLAGVRLSQVGADVENCTALPAGPEMDSCAELCAGITPVCGTLNTSCEGEAWKVAFWAFSDGAQLKIANTHRDAVVRVLAGCMIYSNLHE